jgi:hypothetical protein
MKTISASGSLPVMAFVFAFMLIPISHLDALVLMPGDIGDARLNNYFLENVFQFFVGGSNSLWHLPFFFPFPYVLGFSDNLFGSAPVYVLARLFNAGTDTAYQIWFLFGYLANFTAAYYALRRLNGSVIGATVGALIFAFALPTSAHAGHAQLHYRFGLPMSVVFFADFLTKKTWRDFLIAGGWLVWQFYAGVYIGFFTLLLLFTMFSTYVGHALITSRATIVNILKDHSLSWSVQSRYEKTIFFVSSIFLLVLLLLLFYPYIQASLLYDAKRSWGEIAIMLPRPQSYFLSDASFLWGKADAKIFAEIPMRHEHQMFIGMGPLVLALIGFLIGSREKNDAVFTLMAGMLGIAIVLTLYVGGFSLWYLLHKLPLVSAIRAMTRIDQAFLFPAAYFAAVAIDNFRIRYRQGTKVVLVLILPALIAEAAMTSMHSSVKDSWRQRFSTLNASVPVNLPDNSILFFAQRQGPPFADDLDAMWVSLHHRKKTLNGYSGFWPPNYDYEFGSDCAQIPRRAVSYLEFSRELGELITYRELMSRVVPVGFKNCDPSWWQDMPSLTSADRIYSAQEFRALSLGAGVVQIASNTWLLNVVVSNSADYVFSANSAVGKPIRLSWRYIDSGGKPSGGWDTRKGLPFDVPAKGDLKVLIPLDVSKTVDASAVQVSIVQELEFWGHDVGVEPVTIHLK